MCSPIYWKLDSICCVGQYTSSMPGGAMPCKVLNVAQVRLVDVMHEIL